MNRPSTLRAAAIVAIAAALLLAGCGRKGRLDPPPDAPAVPQANAPPSGEQRQDLLTQTPDDDKPSTPGVPKRRLPIDVPLN